MKISEWSNSEKENNSILNLTKRVYGDEEISKKSYFDWQYLKNPFGEALIIVAKEKDEVIGTNSIIPMELWIEKKLVKASLACNVQVEKKFQRQGVFSKLLDFMRDVARKNKISFLYAVPNDNSFNSFIKHDSTKISSLPLYVKILKPSEYFESNLGKILKVSDFIWKPKKTENFHIESFNQKFSNEFEVILEKAKERIPILINKNIKFLEWRYNQHPTRNYQIFVLKENSKIKGYIILRVTTFENKKIGVIEDFLLDMDVKNKKNFEDLVNTAIQFFYKKDVSVIISTFNDQFLEGKILKNTGFLKAPNFIKPVSLHFIIMKFEKNELFEKTKNYKNWFFSFGDYDVF